jgi:hypothetical protein
MTIEERIRNLEEIVGMLIAGMSCSAVSPISQEAADVFLRKLEHVFELDNETSL